MTYLDSHSLLANADCGRLAAAIAGVRSRQRRACGRHVPQSRWSSISVFMIRKVLAGQMKCWWWEPPCMGTAPIEGHGTIKKDQTNINRMSASTARTVEAKGCNSVRIGQVPVLWE